MEGKGSDGRKSPRGRALRLGFSVQPAANVLCDPEEVTSVPLVLISKEDALRAWPTFLLKVLFTTHHCLHPNGFLLPDSITWPEDLLGLQEDGTAKVGQARSGGTLALRNSPQQNSDRSGGCEDWPSCPLEQDSSEGACSQPPQWHGAPAAPRGPLPIKHPVFYPFLPPLTSLLLLPETTSEMKNLHSNPVPGSTPGRSQTKTRSLIVKEDSSPEESHPPSATTTLRCRRGN